MRIIMTSMAMAALLAACSDESAKAPEPEQTVAASLQPGEYEITAKVDALTSTDKTTPKTQSKVGDEPKVTKTCVPADGTIEPAAFVEAGESCTPGETYMRNGRMSLQYKCTRGGGQVTQMVDGNFKADSFEAKVSTATYFAGDGDYRLMRSFTAKRIGDCAAEPVKP